MKNLLSIVLLFFYISTYGQEGCIITNKASVFSRADLDSKRIGILNPGDTVKVLDQKGLFKKISNSNLSGFVQYTNIDCSGEFVVNVNPQITEEPYKTKLKYKEDRVVFDTIIEINGRSADDLFSGIQEWIAKEYVSSKTVTRLNDPENHKYLLKAIQFIQNDNLNAFSMDMDYTLKAITKDNKARLIIEDMFFNIDIGFGQRRIDPIKEYISNEKLFKSNGKIRTKFKNYKTEIVTFWNERVKSFIKALEATTEDEW